MSMSDSLGPSLYADSRDDIAAMYGRPNDLRDYGMRAELVPGVVEVNPVPPIVEATEISADAGIASLDDTIPVPMPEHIRALLDRRKAATEPFNINKVREPGGTVGGDPVAGEALLRWKSQGKAS